MQCPIDNGITVQTTGRGVKYITVENKEHFPFVLSRLPEGSKHITIYGPSGGINLWFNLTPEQCWVLSDMLMEGVE